jgi:hypothetical protein
MWPLEHDPHDVPLMGKTINLLPNALAEADAKVPHEVVRCGRRCLGDRCPIDQHRR